MLNVPCYYTWWKWADFRRAWIHAIRRILLQFPWTFVLPAFASSIFPHPQRYSRPHDLPTSNLDITDVLQVPLVLDPADLDTIFTPADMQGSHSWAEAFSFSCPQYASFDRLDQFASISRCYSRCFNQWFTFVCLVILSLARFGIDAYPPLKHFLMQPTNQLLKLPFRTGIILLPGPTRLFGY